MGLCLIRITIIDSVIHLRSYRTHLRSRSRSDADPRNSSLVAAGSCKRCNTLPPTRHCGRERVRRAPRSPLIQPNTAVRRRAPTTDRLGESAGHIHTAPSWSPWATESNLVWNSAFLISVSHPRFSALYPVAEVPCLTPQRLHSSTPRVHLPANRLCGIDIAGISLNLFNT